MLLDRYWSSKTVNHFLYVVTGQCNRKDSVVC